MPRLPLGILQANMGRALRAQDLFLHTIAERDLGLGVVLEPHRIPDNHTLWHGSECGFVAVYQQPRDDLPACAKISAGNGYVAVRWGPVTVVGVYILPRHDLAQFEAIVDGLGIYLSNVPGPIIIAGDFNAKSQAWGYRRTDGRGGVFCPGQLRGTFG